MSGVVSPHEHVEILAETLLRHSVAFGWAS